MWAILLFSQIVLKSYNYCLIIATFGNFSKTKVVVFRKGDVLPRNMAFCYNGERIIKICRYGFRDIFFSKAQITLTGQVQKAIFNLNSYLYTLVLTSVHMHGFSLNFAYN